MPWTTRSIRRSSLFSRTASGAPSGRSGTPGLVGGACLDSTGAAGVHWAWRKRVGRNRIECFQSLTSVLVGTIRHDSGGVGTKLGNDLGNQFLQPTTCTFAAANLAFPLEEYLVQRSGRCIVGSFGICGSATTLSFLTASLFASMMARRRN